MKRTYHILLIASELAVASLAFSPLISQRTTLLAQRSTTTIPSFRKGTTSRTAATIYNRIDAYEGLVNSTTDVSWENVVHHPSQLQPHPHDRVTLGDACLIAGVAVMLVALSAWLVQSSGPGAWRYYMSGGLCAAISHAVPVPIDVVKTRKQVDPELASRNFLQATKDIIQAEGLVALSAGLGPTVVGYLLEGALKFGVYEVLKPVLLHYLYCVASMSSSLAFLKSKVAAFMLSGAAAGMAASVMLCPMEALRIRMVADSQFAKMGWLRGGFRMIKTEGASAFTKGLIPMFYKQVPYTVTKNVSFDYITKYAYHSVQNFGFVLNPFTKFAVPFLSAAVASVLSCITSQPGDMLLSLVNASEGEQRSTRRIASDIMKSERGVRGFFVGIKTRLLHVGIIVTLQLLIYDIIKRACGCAATGSV